MMEEFTKTVDEKEAELAEAREENIKYARQIEDYQSEVSSFKEKLEKADVRYLTEISRLNKQIQKIKAEIKAMEEKTEIHSQTTEETTKVELDTELLIYKEYLDLMEGRFKIHETDESAGGEYFVSEESTETMKKTETKTKIVEAYYDQEKIHHSQETETSVSQHEEAENQGQGGSPVTVGYNQGWNGTKDWSEHFKERQNLQKPGSPEEGQSESDPKSDNEEEDQGPYDSDGRVDSKTDYSDDGQYYSD